MLLAEALGRDGFRDRVKIYATDVDDHALGEARAASYSERQVQPVPPDLLERYFVRENDRFVFDKDLRRSVIFGRHDLIQDAPISRVNILICRNTLMYFNTEAQNRILARFHFALWPGRGAVSRQGGDDVHPSQRFAPIDLRRRVFKKIAKDGWRDRMAIMNQAAEDDASNGSNGPMYPAVFDAAPHAQIAIDPAGALAMSNERARSLFNILPSDLGRPIQDLEMSYRPLELRSLIDQAMRERRTVTVKDLEWQVLGPRAAVLRGLDRAARSTAAAALLASASRSTTCRVLQELQAQLNRARHDLETAYEELQSTNEELETTNEELQSTVEELETTNEELQSTNEELETMNEELQSSNEELQTINEELRQRGDDLNRSNGFLESILTGMRSGVVVLDRELHVIAWNPRAEDLWGLRADEVQAQNFLNLDIGLPIEQLRAGIRACLNGDGDHTEQVVPATNRRGRAITCRVTATPLNGANKEIRGVILLMDEQAAGVAASALNRRATMK